MSINHIIYDSVADDEKLDVKFKNVYCDQVITGSGPSPSADGYIDAQTGAIISTPTANVMITGFLPSSATGIKNHSTFIWTFKFEFQLVAQMTNFYIDARLPDSIKTYFDANPSAFETYLMSVNAMANTVESSATVSPNGMYYASSIVKQTTDTVRFRFLSSNGNQVGPIPNIQNVNVQIIFSGPASV